MSQAGAAAPGETPQETYRQALDAHRLTFQHCRHCGNNWLPARAECPRCWSDDFDWHAASGNATVHSWVVFHVAFDPRYRDRVPYNVALVDLDEGPRLITNIIDMPDDTDVIGRRVALVFEEDMDRQLPRFRLTGDATGSGKS
ncbi:DNA-binding protein [Zhengella mangrovi]|uniref:DNA-binding protein n=1 Tax=Zhengella mangrovi TaxID=1982044 RepID=A0A2G1QQH2_9HYPH|nr:OB-fold domain-containing protein [Zhengella mangrovi]PHP67773.1 DNA-binding protein [Zhengella mangrovi]